MSKKRIPCPHCSEEILPSAKKCRFCGERLDRKKKQLSIVHLYCIWLGAMIAFFILLAIVRRLPTESMGTSFILLGLSVLVGTIAYLGMMVDILLEIRTRAAQKLGLVSIITFVSFFLLLLHIDSVEAFFGVPPISQNQVIETHTEKVENPTPSPTPTATPTKQNTSPPTTNQEHASNQIDCTGPDGVVFQSTQEECDAFNAAWGNTPTPDPHEYIRCNIHANCGGGYKEMTRASCDRVTCCQINGSWELRDEGQCNTEQEQEADAAWIDFCNGLYDPDNCSTYWDKGTTYWYDCRSDAFDGRLRCYEER